uniref:Cell division protein FtsI (Peptidoglycan synthetase) n=1 Tax=uncultured bacterium contig00034 TaxID=1181523 RepID=A0A806KC32_9BACT|nr:cell division protein FtsI (Peptidoglycan synthetase) [uncultured bacterium contig00034]
MRQLAIRQNSAETVIAPARGGILDRNRLPLVDSELAYNVILDVISLDSLKPSRGAPDPQQTVLLAINEALGIPLSTLGGYLNKDADGNLLRRTHYLILAKQVPPDAAMRLKGVPCVYLEENYIRYYPDPYVAPQVVGFARGDAVWGLERQYGAELAGASGRIFRTYGPDQSAYTDEVPATDGYWLITTLDSGIQRIAQEAVDAAAADIDCEYAGMLIMQPQTGEILAMAQWPSFALDTPDNGARFTDAKLGTVWDALREEEKLTNMYRAWGNFLISRSFEPGSIFKPVVVAAALEENLINPSIDAFFCNGVRTLYDVDLPCWNIHGHGSQTVREVIMNSCNVAMIDIIQRLGRDKFYKYRSDFGYGERTDIDLPGEEAVSAPGVMYTLSQLNPVELATSSFGQGFNNTSIQAVSAFAAIINGGNLMKPYIVAQIVDGRGNIVKENTPTVVRRVISQETSDYMRLILKDVVSEQGTGRRAIIEGYEIGGKTGTAQQGLNRDWTVIAFMGYFPVDNPEYLALALVYRPAEYELSGGASAAPMLRDAFVKIIDYKQIPPAGAEQNASAAENYLNREPLGDYTGKQLTEVTRNLNNLGLDYQIYGSGSIVASHIPAAGQATPRDAPVHLYLDNTTGQDGELVYLPNVEGLTEERARAILTEAGFTPVVFADNSTAGRTQAQGEPVTGAGTPRGAAGDTVYADVLYVYRQYPSYGLYIQRGTEIKLKVRRQ